MTLGTKEYDTREASIIVASQNKAQNCFLCHKRFKRNESTKRLAGHSKHARVCKRCTEEWRVKVV